MIVRDSAFSLKEIAPGTPSPVTTNFTLVLNLNPLPPYGTCFVLKKN
jgi:hypothetical protein